jgi:hypothetical protein
MHEESEILKGVDAGRGRCEEIGRGGSWNPASWEPIAHIVPHAWTASAPTSAQAGGQPPGAQTQGGHQAQGASRKEALSVGLKVSDHFVQRNNRRSLINFLRGFTTPTSGCIMQTNI